ncbi:MULTISPECIES: hypothetical protein [Streptomyces]|uniref:Uncharacterized protein n=1 Tax=Streptomyces venezuelae TaxID=54571 RepID=A0A5P2AQK3_STRVZ|nr:hypothetical protein [Streptomyces venezuelae]QES20453.1 hypothetical protein DEJ46_16095 [Streptomyces venezuelae]
MVSQAPAPVHPLADADASLTDPDTAFIRANTLVSAATRSTLMVEQLLDEHHRRGAVDKVASALAAYRTAKASGDDDAASEAAALLGVRWVVAEAAGATPADVLAAADEVSR